MSKIMRIDNFDVAPLQRALLRNPRLWDEITVRTENTLSPHREVSDIIVRYNDWSNYTGDMKAWNGKHDSVWYPCIAAIPEVKDLVFRLMTLVKGERLGAVLITKIPAGKQCYPHVDGSWHADSYDKYGIQVSGNSQQAFCFKGERLSTDAGDVFWFDNSYEHWVTNDSDIDRITLIVCIQSHRYIRSVK